MSSIAADEFRGIGRQIIQECSPYGVKNVSSDFTSDISSKIDIKNGLRLVLRHFTASSFPRTISTKTTQGRQVTVYNEAEALARFAQANYLNCRINAYSGGDIKGDPNFIFIDIET